MSTDNGIYILITKDQFKRVPHNRFSHCEQNMFTNPVLAYRVTHTQGIDNFYYLKEKQIYMLGKYMWDTWGNALVFYTEQEAVDHAKKLEDSMLNSFLEYGISFIDATEFSFN